ncbi:MAG: hypothetical protein HN380_29235, partial [Victivallales bacterium]|nr:hypothetical protein [Victivallales bacterium]
MPKPTDQPESAPVHTETKGVDVRSAAIRTRAAWLLRKCLRFARIALVIVIVGTVLIYLRQGPFWLSTIEIICGKPATLETVYTYSDLKHG